MKFHQFLRAQVPEIARFDAPWLTVTNLVDPPAGAMDAGAFVAFARVAPVEHEHAAIGTVTEFHAAEPGIARKQKIRPMPSDVTRAAAFEDFLIHAAAMQVDREQPAIIFRGPIVAEVNHHAHVRVAAAVGVRLAVARIPPTHRSVEMPMVRVLID